MGRQYSAFLIRHWRFGDDETRRIEVVHIQSSAHAVVTSLRAAAEWIDARSREPVTALPRLPDNLPGGDGGFGDA